MNNKLFLTLFFAFTLSLNVFADNPGEEVVEEPVAAEESTETESSSDDSSSDDAPAPVAAPQLPRTGAVIATPPRADVIPQTGLTATETALLSPEEQIIRARTRT